MNIEQMHINSYLIDHADYEFERICGVPVKFKEITQELAFFNHLL